MRRKQRKKRIYCFVLNHTTNEKVKRRNEKDTISYQAGKHRILPSPQLDMWLTPVVR